MAAPKILEGLPGGISDENDDKSNFKILLSLSGRARALFEAGNVQSMRHLVTKVDCISLGTVDIRW